MSKIIIHFDFCVGEELPYYQSLKAIERKESFYTNCINLFSFDHIFYDGYDDVIILESTGKYISAKELLDNTGEYTNQEIRKAHNIFKIFIAGGFNWKTH